jgi:hypothetical protein
MTTRRPTPAQMGDVVTIAIVALTAPYEHFVCVSDRMISHDDILPADDNALIKNLGLSKNWSVTFSANKIENALPLLDNVQNRIAHPTNPASGEEMQAHFVAAVADKIRADFFNLRLRRYGYRNIEQFRREGRDELGDLYFELCRELQSAETGVEFIVYGYDDARVTRLFEVTGKGEIIDRMTLRYAVVGSGYWMASASLKRKPLSIDFESMVYRCMEAKFSAETASGVGRTTTVRIKRRDQHDFQMSVSDVEEIRAIWERKTREPEPSEAAVITGKMGMQLRREDQMRAHLSGTGT